MNAAGSLSGVKDLEPISTVDYMNDVDKIIGAFAVAYGGGSIDPFPAKHQLDAVVASQNTFTPQQ